LGRFYFFKKLTLLLSKDIKPFTWLQKISISNKLSSFIYCIFNKPWKKVSWIVSWSSSAVFNIDNNNEYFLSTK